MRYQGAGWNVHALTSAGACHSLDLPHHQAAIWSCRRNGAHLVAYRSEKVDFAGFIGHGVISFQSSEGGGPNFSSKLAINCSSVPRQLSVRLPNGTVKPLQVSL